MLAAVAIAAAAGGVLVVASRYGTAGLGRVPASRSGRALVPPRQAPASPPPAATAVPSLTEVEVPPPRSAESAEASVQGPPPAPAEQPESPAGEAPSPVSAPQPRGLSNGKTYKGSVALPDGGRIELGGVAWSEDDPHALVNDRVVGVGALVEGFEVTWIAEDRIALEKDGLKIYVAVK